MSDKKSNELFQLAEFYQENLIPNTYIYEDRLGIRIELSFRYDQFCHLIFGYVKGIPNAVSYKGERGFEKIINLQVTSPPPYNDIPKKYKSKKDAFYYIPELLKKPKIYMFNKQIVNCGNIKGLKGTDIDADFLLYKEFDNGKQIHLFLKWSDDLKKIVPYSLIKNNKDNYIEKQIELKKIICLHDK